MNRTFTIRLDGRLARTNSGLQVRTVAFENVGLTRTTPGGVMTLTLRWLPLGVQRGANRHLDQTAGAGHCFFPVTGSTETELLENTRDYL